MIKRGACGAAGPALAQPLSLGRPARRTPGPVGREISLDRHCASVTQVDAHRDFTAIQAWSTACRQ